MGIAKMGTAARCRVLGAVCLGAMHVGSLGVAAAATIAPPMLDITRQCNASHHTATAMSECVVAESEARSEILQKWNRIPDASAEKCVKIGKKARRFPYSAMAKCLSLEPVDTTVAAPAAPGR